LVKAALAAVALLVLPAGGMAAAPLHIVAFGDSATSGWLVARSEAYPAQLQAALRKKGYDVTVENAGVPGDSFAGGMHRLDRAVGPATDIVLVEFGTNDRRAGASMETVEKRLAAMVRVLKARGIGVLVIGLGSLDLSAAATASGVPYAQWKLPPHKYRARDGAHFNAEGYRIVVERMLPQVEALIAKRR
jgi:acyl-CoA thioesterase-1